MAYLENKHRGGISGEKGSKYESFYTTFKVADYLSTTTGVDGDIPEVLFQSQVMAYLDDLLITDNTRRIYHQIKNVANFRWPSVEGDFIKQKDASEQAGENYKLVLVYSDSKFNKDVPIDLEPCTDFSYFPYDPSIYTVIEKSSDFKSALKRILKFANPSDDKLYALAVCILGYWIGNDMQKGLTLKNFKDCIVSNSNISTIFDRDISISNECRRILDSIPGFSYTISGNSIVWESRRYKDNVTIWSRDLEARIISKSPQTINDIVKLM